MMLEKKGRLKQFEAARKVAAKAFKAAKFLAIPLLVSGIIKSPSASAQSNMAPFNSNPQHSMRLEGLSFPSLQNFCTFNRSLAADFSEQQKVGLCSDWLGVFAGGIGLGMIDKSRAGSGLSLLFNGYTAETVFEKHQKGQLVGMCGDLNVVMLNKLCETFGLRVLSASVSTNAIWHIMGFIPGKEGNYLVNYGKAYSLDKNVNIAADQVSLVYSRFSPYAYTLTKGGAFFLTPTDKLLRSLLGLEEGKREEGIGIQLSADRYGNFGASPYSQFGEYKIGFLFLRSATASTLMLGAYADFNRDKGKIGGSAFPRMAGYLGFGETAGNTFPVLVGTALPYLQRMRINSQTRLELTPLQLDFSTSFNNLNPRMLSRAKLLRQVGKESVFSLQLDAAAVLSLQNFYSISEVRPTEQIKVGFSGKKFSLEGTWVPDSYISKAELGITQGFNIGPANMHSRLELNFLGPNGKFFQNFNLSLTGRLH